MLLKRPNDELYLPGQPPLLSEKRGSVRLDIKECGESHSSRKFWLLRVTIIKLSCPSESPQHPTPPFAITVIIADHVSLPFKSAHHMKKPTLT